MLKLLSFMLKWLSMICIFVLSLVFFSQLPGFIYKYQTVLEGEYLALSRDYDFYISQAKIRNKTLESYFNDLSKKGDDVKSIVEYELSNIHRFMKLQKQKDRLDNDDPFDVTLLVLFESDYQIAKVAWEKFSFEVSLGMSYAWGKVILSLSFVMIMMILLLRKILGWCMKITLSQRAIV